MQEKDDEFKIEKALAIDEQLRSNPHLEMKVGQVGRREPIIVI